LFVLQLCRGRLARAYRGHLVRVFLLLLLLFRSMGILPMSITGVSPVCFFFFFFFFFSSSSSLYLLLLFNLKFTISNLGNCASLFPS